MNEFNIFFDIASEHLPCDGFKSIILKAIELGLFEMNNQELELLIELDLSVNSITEYFGEEAETSEWELMENLPGIDVYVPIEFTGVLMPYNETGNFGVFNYTDPQGNVFGGDGEYILSNDFDRMRNEHKIIDGKHRLYYHSLINSDAEKINLYDIIK